MNMPKYRDIQAKIPLPQAIWNEFGYVTVNEVNSNIAVVYTTKHIRKAVSLPDVFYPEYYLITDYLSTAQSLP